MDLVEWSKIVRERDKKCILCGDDQNLHAHHISPKHEFPETKYDLENGVAMCQVCHMFYHKLYPGYEKGAVNKKSLEKFMNDNIRCRRDTFKGFPVSKIQRFKVGESGKSTPKYKNNKNKNKKMCEKYRERAIRRKIIRIKGNG